VRRFSRPGIVFLARALALVSCLVSISAWSATDYRLGAGDSLRITVYERPDLSAAYVIGPSGDLSLPSVGELAVTGLTAASLETVISEKLGLKHDDKNHWVSVEITAFRPFFIVGSVRSPGSYPYVSQMTVLHAISLAGGYKPFELDNYTDRAAAAVAREKLRKLKVSLVSSLLQKARLTAEYQNDDEISFPSEAYYYVDEGILEEFKTNEVQIFTDRRASAIMQKDALEIAKENYNTEIRAHRQHFKLAVRQSELLTDEIKSLSNSGPGVVPHAYILSLERAVTEVEGTKSEVDAYIARAKQQLAALELQLVALDQDRKVEIAKMLQTTMVEIVTLKIGIQEIEQVLGTTNSGSRSSPAEEGNDITIVRASIGGLIEVQATELTPVEPGDVIKVSGSSLTP